MKLRKRVEALELAEKQRNCDHFFMSITIENKRLIGSRNTAYFDVVSECEKCGKEINRNVRGEEISAAESLLRKQIEANQ